MRDVTTTQAWIEVLDDIEHGIDTYERRYLDGEDVDVEPAPVPPAGIGPLPPTLEARACAVLARLRATEAKLARIPRPGVSGRRARFASSDTAGATFEQRM